MYFLFKNKGPNLTNFSIFKALCLNIDTSGSNLVLNYIANIITSADYLKKTGKKHLIKLTAIALFPKERENAELNKII